ncbi:MAG TPA: molybdopterin-dependent oxidoreductase [bacterium]|nr:molybdopterin-dependent oxidoreductase [bacterium]
MSILSGLDTPVFAAEGVPENTDAGAWRVRVDGLAQQEAELGLADIKALPNVILDARLTSVSGWSVRAQWEGTPWTEFMKRHPGRPEATHVTFVSAGGYATTAPLTELSSPRVLLCWGVGGEPLEPDYGGPLRMLIPNLWGYKSCKWVVRITYANSLVPGYWETRGYTNHGRIEPGTTMDVNTRTRRAIKGGEVTQF